MAGPELGNNSDVLVLTSLEVEDRAPEGTEYLAEMLTAICPKTMTEKKSQFFLSHSFGANFDRSYGPV